APSSHPFSLAASNKTRPRVDTGGTPVNRKDERMCPARHRYQGGIRSLIRLNVEIARLRWGPLPKMMVRALRSLSIAHRLSVQFGDLLLLDGKWYVTHTGLLRLARRSRYAGIAVEALPELSNVSGKHWAF